jgi:hypothetical protein
MVSYEVPVTGEAMVQPDQPYYNIIFNDQEGVLYNPQASGKIIAEFTKTFNPSLGRNFAWGDIQVNWTRDAPATPLDGFKTTFLLEGILPNGQIDVVGKQIIDTIPSTALTEDVSFPLMTSRMMPSLSKVSVGTATSGKIQVNLPKTYFYYSSITLDCDSPTLSISPDTATEDDTVLIFTLPGGYTPGSMLYLTITEIRQTEYVTPSLAVYNQDTLDLGYNGVDHYAAMKLTTKIEADNTCNVRINSEKYSYEV